MNVTFLHFAVKRILLAASLLLSLSVGANAQRSNPFRQLNTSVGSPVADTVSGRNLDIALWGAAPKHGTLDITLLSSGGVGSTFVYRVAYIPNPGFVGVDTFTLEQSYVSTYPYLVYRAYRVAVAPSDLNARPDFAYTLSGAPVAIDVLDNDYSSKGPLVLRAIPAVNHGTAEIQADQSILFTPAPGFSGTAHFNYTVCDAAGYCQTTAADISVNKKATPVNDTVSIYTAKNTLYGTALPYSGYALFQAPLNGKVSIENGQAMYYTPDFNYAGSDQFVLVNESFGKAVYRTVRASVLNTVSRNIMAMADYIYTPKNEAVTSNVRANDIGALTIKSWEIPANFPGTITNTNSNGDFTFTPKPGFSGVAVFYYKIGNSFAPDVEAAPVYLIVNNLAPSAGLFNLSTPVGTPLVIEYPVPFKGYHFKVTDAPGKGKCAYYPGFSTQTFNGQSVSGYNLLIYTPPAGFVGTDEFEINYCINSNGECQTVKVAVNVSQVVGASGPYCLQNCLWTGDIDANGVVNNYDLLPLGRLLGASGPARPSASLEWYGQQSDDWKDPFADSFADLKHADSDGNGLVTADDSLAISVFYSQTRQLTPRIPPTSKGLPFYFNFLTPNAQMGEQARIEVSLGNAKTPVADVYGFVFEARLSSNIVAYDMKMDYYANSWVNQNAPYLALSKNPLNGKVESAFTRANGKPASGFGPVGELNYIVIDIIDGSTAQRSINEAYTLQISNASVQWADGSLSVFEDMEIELPMPRKTAQQSVAHATAVYPSPTNGITNIQTGGEAIHLVEVFDIAGKNVYQAPGAGTSHVADLHALAEGMYMVRVHTASGVHTKKIEVAKR